ncbi:hypothetical protein WSM22_34880 [Cytophagales bacterium WSM2-2]|nr:hypothetical protein WSM22_34880 [Cytophagales bacterium WSM2-2]
MPRFLVAIFFLSASPLFSQVIDLDGSWKFHIGDQADWSASNFDDSRWSAIKAPAYWEDQGFNGYDGFAWYRRKFDGRNLDKDKNYCLGVGYIDDTDEVYFNGKLVGFSGSMPPHYRTAFNNERRYQLPPDLINYQGENTIAVRVFDAALGGGIADGKLGLYETNKYLLIDLQGIWSFAKSKRGDPIKNENNWKQFMVPSMWEYNGYAGYDGFGWYKRTFSITSPIPKEPLFFLAGKIDDFDEVYLNGQFIGKTNDHLPYGPSQSYREQRVYTIPSYLLKKGTNTIEILVEDIGNNGGIYGGILGIITKTNYERYLSN